MQAIRSAASHVPGSQSCWQRNWPRFFLLMALAAAVLCFVSVIMGFITAFTNPALYILGIYCLIFSLLGLSAELRQFSWCRRVVYLWMRFFYFLTYYKARAIFYIMFGFLLLTKGVLGIIAAIVAIVLGIVMLLVALIVDLPVFEDPREQQEKEEEFRNYYAGPQPKAGNDAAPPAAVLPPSNNNNNNNGVQADTPAQFKSGSYDTHNTNSAKVPPPQAAKVPPAATAAAAAPTSYRENVSSDDEPAQHDPSSAYGRNNYNYNSNNANSAYGGDATMTAAPPAGLGGPSMFAPARAARVTSDVSPPLQEAGVTRAGNTESATRRDFAAAVASNLKDDDLR